MNLKQYSQYSAIAGITATVAGFVHWYNDAPGNKIGALILGGIVLLISAGVTADISEQRKGEE